jgi:hypothetical protein
MRANGDDKSTSQAALIAFSLELRGILATKSVKESLFEAMT